MGVYSLCSLLLGFVQNLVDATSIQGIRLSVCVFEEVLDGPNMYIFDRFSASDLRNLLINNIGGIACHLLYFIFFLG